MIERQPLHNEKEKLSRDEKLFNFFRDNNLIHHTTIMESFYKIMACSELRFNDGSFKNNFSVSNNSYAKYKKSISLFDLVNTSIKEVEDQCNNWLKIVEKKEVLGKRHSLPHPPFFYCLSKIKK